MLLIHLNCHDDPQLSTSTQDVDEDDRLGEDCIKLLTAEEAEVPYRNYMKNGKGEETTTGALGVFRGTRIHGFIGLV